MNIVDLPRKLWTIFGTWTPYNNWRWLFWSGQDMQAWRSECEQCHVAQALKVALPLPLLCCCSSTMSSVAPGLAHCSSALQYFTPPTSYSRSNLHSQKWANIKFTLQCTLKKTRNSGINLDIESRIFVVARELREKLVGPTPLWSRVTWRGGETGAVASFNRET